jgi:hypothetical protein
MDPNIPTYIGADVRDNGSYFDGLIDEVQVSICDDSPAIAARGSSEASQQQAAAVTDPPVKYNEDKLYPNPAISTLRLQLKDDLENTRNIRVFDGVGKVQPAYSRKINNGLYEINVAALSRGIYIIEVRTATGIKAFRFVKQ